MIAHNKTLAAQLCNEFREFFPDNAVEYFVSYYDYYQPEAYVPAQDLYIEKDSSINDEIDRLRHAATAVALRPPRRDHRRLGLLHLRHRLAGGLQRADAALQGRRDSIDRDEVLRKLVEMQYQRNDVDARPRHLPRARRRARDHAVLRRVGLPDRALRRRDRGDPALRPADRRDPRRDRPRLGLPGHALRDARTRRSSARSRRSSAETANAARPSFEARASSSRRTACDSAPRYDLEMMQELGFCLGDRELLADPRRPRAGQPAAHADRLLPRRLRLSSSTSRHQTIPQIGGMYEGDRSRKQTLVDYGFRLPSALDNRPLKFDEFLERVPQMVMVSATPGPYERARARAGRRADRAPDRASSTRRSRCARRRTRSTT